MLQIMQISLLIALVMVGSVAAIDLAEDVRLVTKGELLAAMRGAEGYSIKATTNAVRFQTTTILRLVHWAQASGLAPGPLFIDHTAWYHAFLELNRLTAEEAPLSIRLAFEHQQDVLIEYGLDCVLRMDASREPLPKLAVNVKLWWPERPGCRPSFSFLDETSVPKLRVTNKRVIRYRILEFEDMIVCEQIDGLRGRPVSGLLGLMFRVIGEGRVVRSRFGVAADGAQVVWTHVKKGPLGKKSLVTVYPDGRAIKGTPTGRTDLAGIASRLKKLKLRLSYRPFDE